MHNASTFLKAFTVVGVLGCSSFSATVNVVYDAGTDAGSAIGGTSSSIALGGHTNGSGGSSYIGGVATGGNSSSSGESTGGNSTVGTLGSGGSTAQHWCETQVRPANVLAGDYQCLDFDMASTVVSPWTQTLSNGGTLQASQDQASSAPTSLRIAIPAVAQADGTASGTIQWHTVGSTAITSARVALQVNPVAFVGGAPSWTNRIDLICLAYGAGRACISYTRGSDVSFASHYTGLFLRRTMVNGAASSNEDQLLGLLEFGVWNSFELITNSGNVNAVNVMLNGAPIGTFGSPFGDGTTADITIGPVAYAVTTEGLSIYVDNIVSSFTRK